MNFFRNTHHPRHKIFFLNPIFAHFARNSSYLANKNAPRATPHAPQPLQPWGITSAPALHGHLLRNKDRNTGLIKAILYATNKKVVIKFGRKDNNTYICSVFSSNSCAV